MIALNTATGVRTGTATNDTGFCVTVEREGFRRYVRKDIVLTTSQAAG